MTAVGYAAGANNTTGGDNCFVGYDAGVQVTTASSITLVGTYAGDSLTTGGNTTCLGYSAGHQATTNGQNTFIGSNAGNSVTTGTNNTMVGYNVGLADHSNAVVLGRDCTSIGSEHVTIGNNSSGRVYNDFATNATWTRSSDRRWKKDINTNDNCGLNFINDLRTVTYKWIAPSERPPEMTGYNPEETEPSRKEKMYGFIAQEVKESLDKHNISNFNGWTEGEDGLQGVSYEMFVIPLVKAVQELSAKNEALEARLAALES